MGAVALNQGIAYLLHGGDLSGSIGAANHEIEEPRVAAAIRTSPRMKRDEVRSGGYVLNTLNAAFWCVLGTDSAEGAIARAVELGSDTDTTGAVTGALAGAHYGTSGLPSRWLDVLHDRDEIKGLANQLVDWSR